MTPRHPIACSFLLLFLLSVSTFTLTSANYFSLGSAHSITNLQTSLGADKKSSISSLTKNTPFLKFNGGSISTSEVEELDESAEEVPKEEEGVEIIETEEAIELEATDDDTSSSVPTTAAVFDTSSSVPTTAAEAAAGLASPPLRISTSQNGNEIVTCHNSEVKRLSRRERRRERVVKKRAMKDEVKSHKTIAKKLKNRNNLNIGRKVLHAGCGLWFATLNQLLPRKIFVPGMVILTSLTFLMECLRYREGFGWMNDVLSFVLGGTLRKHEMEGKFTGSFYYFLGVTVTAACFPTSCASLGICQLALADPSASYFGRHTRHVYWSRIENGFFGIGRNKGLLGFLGGALTCLPFNYYLLSIAKIHAASNPVTRASILTASIALGVAGSFADLCVPTPALTMPKKICGVPMLPFHVDDNVVVPIFSGWACTKIFDYLGWVQGVHLAKLLVI
mmetsp:Transcript_9483/g.14307  ORF Transcript_9483/g.14307 Transcript_9483/m.14307 type:complete len:449 (+) Transcript_9483:199-1545(+)